MHIKKLIHHLIITASLLGAHTLLIFIIDSKIKLTNFCDGFLAISVYLPLIIFKELGYSSQSGFGIGTIDVVIIFSTWFLIYLLLVMIVSKIMRKFKISG